MKHTVLIVEDNELERTVLRELLMDKYRVLEVASGAEALKISEKEYDEICLILLEQNEVRPDNFSLLKEIQAKKCRIPILVLTESGRNDEIFNLYQLGVRDIVTKPIEPVMVLRRVENILGACCYQKQMRETLQAQHQLIVKSNRAIIETLNTIMHHPNMESSEHLLCIQAYTRILLSEIEVLHRELMCEHYDIEMVAKAAMLHDVGKIVIPDRIVNKPGRLGEDEFSVMQTHAEEGCRILNLINQMGNNEFFQCAYEICRHHHERFDGKGYPDGLQGDEISLNAQVVGLADAYDALTSERVYKPPFPHETAVSMILNGECGEFSPVLLDCFLHCADNMRVSSQTFSKNLEKSASEIVQSLANLFSENQLEEIRPIDSFEYYTLLRYMGSSVFEVNFVENNYKQVYPTYLEFSEMEREGVFDGGLLDFLYERVRTDMRESLIHWAQESHLALMKDNLEIRSARFSFYNKILQEYTNYKVTVLPIDEGKKHADRFLFVFKNITSLQSQSENGMNDGAVDLQRYRDENLRLRRRAEIDQLTGLLNKATTTKTIEQLLSKDVGCKHALFLLDLDNFKQINDNYGHLAGDSALSRFAQVLKTQFRESDILGRVGGDEFVVLLKDIDNEEWVINMATGLIATLSGNTNISGKERFSFTVSVGISFFPRQGKELNDLFECADKALYAAKNDGKNQVRVFSSELEHHLGTFVKKRRKDRAESDRKSVDNLSLELSMSLFSSDDLSRRMQSALDLMARKFGLSHILSADQNGQHILFRWDAIKDATVTSVLLAAIGEYAMRIKTNGDVRVGERVISRNCEDQLSALGIVHYQFKPLTYNEQVVGGVIFVIEDSVEFDLPELQYACWFIAQMLSMVGMQLNQKEELNSLVTSTVKLKEELNHEKELNLFLQTELQKLGKM